MSTFLILPISQEFTVTFSLTMTSYTEDYLADKLRNALEAVHVVSLFRIPPIVSKPTTKTSKHCKCSLHSPGLPKIPFQPVK